MKRRDYLPGLVADTVAKWWFHYDEWHPEVLRSMVTDDFAFSCRSDTGATDYEDFITADLVGADAAMSWQQEHRADSPYPLRHNGSNVFLTKVEDDAAEFSSYIFVTKIVDGRPYPVSSGIVTGRVRIANDAVSVQRLDVRLDTRESVRYSGLSEEVVRRV